MKLPRLAIGLASALALVLPAAALALGMSEASVESGALIYKQRCVLCHGGKGMGEGVLPLSVFEYPKTSLLVDQKRRTRQAVENAIRDGIPNDQALKIMPPWSEELSAAEIDDVTEFVMQLRANPEAAYALLDAIQSSPDARRGRLIYETRCTLCHGVSGRGDGRMAKKAKIFNKPPPVDLTMSVVPDEYARAIIQLGGAALSRSDMMPPWGDELTQSEIEDVLAYIVALRVNRSKPKTF